ncbi:MAG TPA: beta-propeller domain-containing protein [Methanomicrobiales archaeon]|nr:beta-propeller domain-containing protein [Methanomicrobiales archaeon]
MENRWLILLSVAAIALIGGIITYGYVSDHPTPAVGGGELKQFSSAAEVRAWLAAHAPSGGIPQHGAVDRAVPMVANGVAEKGASSLVAPALSGDYSTTNVQVQGVDEADIVKNDARYIYVISGGTLAIVDAYPGEKARVLSETPLNGTPAEMYLSGDRLVVFSSGGIGYPAMEKVAGVVAPRSYQAASHACVYDIRDRSSPSLVRDITLPGSYYDSRMIGDRVYVVTNAPVYAYSDDIPMPVVKDDAGVTIEPRISYFDVPFSSYTFSTISSFSVSDDRSLSAESYLMGYTTTLYVSPDAIYMAFPIPSAPSAEPMVAGTMAVAPVPKQPAEEKTAICRFAIADGGARFTGYGEVTGHLLNQFSMDESGGDLRVATTVQGYGSSGSYEYNNVLVLDSGMKTVGSLMYIAPGEQIYAARFIGDRLYLVTFRRVDPLFVIDLSDPSNPGILGKLKIPGFSDYLHPYDATHLIGVGKETESNDWGGISTSGLKLALFDVSDVNHPTEVDHVEIGEAGSDSEALRDHRAFLFSKEKDLLVIPVREVQAVPTGGRNSPSMQEIWQGAYAFSVSPTKGFTLRGKVTHSGDDTSGYYWGSQDAVRRSLFIGDVLYTLSPTEIIATDLGTMSPIREIPLPYGGYGYPVPMAVE